MKVNQLTHEIIGAAIEVHRELGPGKPELAYENALARELSLRGILHQTQKPVPVIYKGVKLECGYRVDVLVENTVVVEAKSVEVVIPIHRAQVLTYMKIGGWKVGLLLNFNVAILKEGVERFVLGFEEDTRQMAGTRSRRDLIMTSETPPPIFCSPSDSGDPQAEELVHQVISAALEVHRHLGPGLLPSAYEICLAHELSLRGMPFELKQVLPLHYKAAELQCIDQVSMVVGGRLVIHPRAVPGLQPVHEADLLSQLRLGGWRLGLLFNFNTIALKDGLRRIVLSRNHQPPGS